MLLIALPLVILMERRVCKGIEIEDTPIMIPSEKRRMRPMTRMILDTLDTVQVACVEHEGIACRVWIDTPHSFDLS